MLNYWNETLENISRDQRNDKFIFIVNDVRYEVPLSFALGISPLITEQYLKDYPTQLDEGMIFKINYDDLVVLGYLDQFRNKNTGESCVGYSNIFRTANETKNTVETYINCGESMTEGYR